MTTLRRELRKTIYDLLEIAYQTDPPTKEASDYNMKQAEIIADTLKNLRAFKEDSNKARYSIDWAAMGVEVTQDEIDAEKKMEEALNAFETDMGCPKSWSWYPAKTSQEKAWKILREFVVEKYQENPRAFQEYKTWSTQQFSRGAMTILTISREPEKFPMSWQSFLDANPNYSNKKQSTKTDNNGLPITY